MAVLNPSNWQHAAIYVCECCGKSLTEEEVFTTDIGVLCEEDFAKVMATQHLVTAHLDNTSMAEIYV